MTGMYRDGGVFVVWVRIGARTWSTIAEDDAALQAARAEADRLAGMGAPASQGKRRECPDELAAEEAEDGIAAVVYKQVGEM